MATSPATTTTIPKTEIKIVSHSGLFYWWPVWAIGYLMAALTWFDGHLMATVPERTIFAKDATGEATVASDPDKKQDLTGRAIWVAPKDWPKVWPKEKRDLPEPRLHMTRSKNPGVLFCIVLLLVVVITNIPLRGLWSVVVIITIILLSVIFALLNVWEHVLQYIAFLDIRINMGGYLFISTVLLIIWLVAFLLFDQQVYMIFTPGQFRVRQEIGAGEMAHDTTGMTVQKQRSDLFRHWILGLGSGDLIVRTSGAHPMQFDLPNVLFLGRKVKEIEEMLRSRQVVAAPAAPAV
jgi:hypothetical protein